MITARIFNNDFYLGKNDLRETFNNAEGDDKIKLAYKCNEHQQEALRGLAIYALQAVMPVPMSESSVFL